WPTSEGRQVPQGLEDSTPATLHPHLYVSGPFASFLRLLHLYAFDLDLAPVTSIVERADAECPPGERFVGRRHDRFGHVVEIDLDGAIADLADQLQVVPAVGPVRPVRAGLTDLFAVGLVHDEDLIRVIVGLLPEVDVVEAVRPLMAEEQTHIAV